MNKELNLFNYLYWDNVREKNLNENKALLEQSKDLLAYVEDDLLALLNGVSIDNNENRVNQAVIILFAQAVKSVKSSLILCVEGYLTNSVMCIRNCLETIFNIKYIVGERSKRLSRAEKYLTKPAYWTNESIKERAYMELDRPLYEIYKVFSNYTHSNFMGTGQNIVDDGTVSTLPSSEKCSYMINMINSIFYSLIKFVNDYYKIENQKFNSIKLSESSIQILETFEAERDVLNLFIKFIKDVGVSEENIGKIIKEYKKDSLKSKKNRKK